MNTMSYKGYVAAVWLDDRDDIFVGKLMGMKAGVMFHAESVPGMRRAMKEAVEHYISSCKELGETPEKPFSGKVALRIPSELHRDVAELAQAKQESINELIVQALRQFVSGHPAH